jgi:hypothetical protein
MLLVAELGGGESAIGAGGAGIFGLLTAFSVGLFKRQRENDQRRDELSRASVDLAVERETRALVERDVALERERAALLNAERVKAELAECERAVRRGR